MFNTTMCGTTKHKLKGDSLLKNDSVIYSLSCPNLYDFLLLNTKEDILRNGSVFLSITMKVSSYVSIPVLKRILKYRIRNK